MTQKRMASGLLAVAVLGIVAGYVGTWVTYQNELAHGASYLSNDYSVLRLPALPGLIIAERVSSGDWQLTEAWRNRHLIATANGLFWFGAAGIVYLLRFALLARTTPPSTIADY